ncbi:hypothetical protein DPMN_052835 [Dreissena polymorpha]|uniref:Peptidase S1 domain-containing protein n=1 Tax=Dreissena polymorpha TaxID=45954 RepID=A0A9D4HPP2_DREPO|nr:hypothetical protein DPMN_052835 [Dreissena polymorpha]
MDGSVCLSQDSSLEFTKKMNPREIHSRSLLKQKKIHKSSKQSSKIEKQTIMVPHTKKIKRSLRIPIPAKHTKRTNEENKNESMQDDKLFSLGSRILGECSRKYNDTCKSILTFDHVRDVFPAHKSNDTSSVVFVVTVENETDAIIKNLDDLGINYIIKNLKFSNVGKTINNVIQMTEIEVETLRTCVRNNAKKLMEKHRYLSIIEGCSYILDKEPVGATNALNYEPRLALYVHAKGYIPIDEEPFDTSYDGIKVVIRVGVFVPFARKADEFHEHVRMGCKIQRSLNGTLGLFVEHHSYGLCGVSCAHVLLSAEEMMHCRERNGRIVLDSIDCDVYQPEHPHKIGILREDITKEGSDSESGLDIALFQISTRFPQDGKFPQPRISNMPDKSFESGRTIAINVHNDKCYKFGSCSDFTEGKLINLGHPSCVRDVLQVAEYTFTICNQVRVQSQSGHLFANIGDSGAPVFVKDGDGQLACIGIIVGGRASDGVVYVTPITRILQELGISKLKSFVPNFVEMANDVQTIKNRMEHFDTVLQKINEKLDSITPSAKAQSYER